MNRKMSQNLINEVEKRIKNLEASDQYFRDFLRDASSATSSASVDGQVGTSTPRYFGAMNTFLANPSNVGIGILARMIETDDTVLCAVQFKSLMMLSKIGEYAHDNPEIQKFVRDFLEKMEEPTWTESLEAMSSYVAYGFSVSEVIWGLNKKLQKIPKKVKTYHPSTICFEVDPWGDITKDGIVQFVIQNAQISNPNNYWPYFQYGFTVKNPFETPSDRLLPYRMPFINNYGCVRIPKAKCIHHTNGDLYSFGSPYGKSQVRTAHLAWQLKVFFLKQLGIAGKRQATPAVWGTAPVNQNKVRITTPDGMKEELSPMEAMAKMMSNRETDDALITGPKEQGYSIEVINAEADLDQFLNVINQLNTYIFRSFLLPSLVMTDGSAGSRSLGDKHFQIVDFMAEQESKKFCEVIIKQMIRPAIEANFGEQDNYGKFTERPQTIEERERLANLFSTVANSGFMKAYDKADGDYVRSALHLPKQDESFYVKPMPDFNTDKDSEDEDGPKET